MTYFQAVVLALVQGVTEFLPISSSAHLVLVPRFLGWPDQGLGFDVATNTGTLAAVVLYFRSELMRVGRAGLGSLKRLGNGPEAGGTLSANARLAWAVVLGTAPVLVAGFLAYDLVAGAARSPLVIAVTSIGFGLLLWWADRAGARRRALEEVSWWDAAVVGFAQALALIPGTSRSGITITAGLARGFTRVDAARFSFLLYVPVGVLAAGKAAWEAWSAGIDAGALGPTLVGFAVAAGSAYLAIGGLLAWVGRQNLTVFVVYRLLLGAVILLALAN